MPVYKDNDIAYLEWVDQNPDGFVINTRAKPDRDYLVLHRARCKLISTPREDPAAYTGNAYIKLATPSMPELRALMTQVIGAPCDVSKSCGKCKP